MIACMCINLGLLAVFKYGNFGIDTINYVVGKIGISTIDRRFDFC